MRYAVPARLVIASTVAIAVATPCLANDFPPLHSQWRSETPAMCIEITAVSEQRDGSDCVQIAADSKGSLLSGYACAKRDGQDRVAINLFRDLGGDNSLGPDILIGKYDATAEPETMSFQYCVRPSNDWPPEYACDHSVTFTKVSSCTP
jgi:hypothetical protein